jgi:hypothetical protein
MDLCSNRLRYALFYSTGKLFAAIEARRTAVGYVPTIRALDYAGSVSRFGGFVEVFTRLQIRCPSSFRSKSKRMAQGSSASHKIFGISGEQVLLWTFGY